MEYVARDAGFMFERHPVAPEHNHMRAATKTGTTICGLVFSSGIVLGADTRSTNGETVADKDCAKIHFIARNIYCCGAGTAADTEAITGLVSSELLLHRSLSDRASKVVTTLTMLKEHLFRYQGHIGAALILGGVDTSGPHLFSVYPHGSSDSLPYAAMGSGSLAAISVLENGYHDGMSEDEAKKLIVRAIRSGIFNDLGSGSNVDLCVITQSGAKEYRNYEEHNVRSSDVRERTSVNDSVELNNANISTSTSVTVPVNTE